MDQGNMGYAAWTWSISRKHVARHEVSHSDFCLWMDRSADKAEKRVGSTPRPGSLALEKLHETRGGSGRENNRVMDQEMTWKVLEIVLLQVCQPCIYHQMEMLLPLRAKGQGQ